MRRQAVARLLACLIALGGLVVAITLLLPAAPGRDTSAMALIAAASGALGAGLFLVSRWAAGWFLKLVPALVTLLASGMIYYSGPNESAAYALSLAWTLTAASLLFRTRWVAIHGFFAVAMYVVVLVARDTPEDEFGLQVTVAAGAVMAVAVAMAGMVAQLGTAMDRLASAARTDPLTDLLNRRALADAFERELERAERGGHPVGLVLLDLDGFKRYNDENGHPAGDRALKRLAAVLEETTRGIDLVARIGGEEFAVLAPESDTAGTLALAERIRRAVEVEFSGAGRLTVSCGVASYPLNGHARAQLVSAADRALYDAKARGKNLAVASTPGSAKPTPESESA